MKRPLYNINTPIKVTCKDCIGYGQRGTVAELKVDIDGKSIDPILDKELLKQAYADGLEPKMTWYARIKFSNDDGNCWFKADELEAVQHKFVDIDYIREEDLDLGITKPDGTKAIRPKNTGAFEVGDIIQITTKIDGANASIAWDETTGKLEIFSRTNLLDQPGALRGFYDYIKTEVEPKADWSQWFDLVFFGEWCVKHSITTYNKDWFNKWRIYDIWDKTHESYLPQTIVKNICKQLGLEYIEELYYGPFISWEHCRSFLGKSTAYGPEQEGIVIKNQTKLEKDDNKNPIYIKIVDDKFKEHISPKSHKLKVTADPEKQKELEQSTKLMETIVTEARMKKVLLKLIDEGTLPSELAPKDVGSTIKHMSKRVFEDVLKEEPETMSAVGQSAGKICNNIVIKFVKALVLGH